MNKLSRREFLKSTATITAATSLSFQMPRVIKALTESKSAVKAPSIRTTYSQAACAGCHQRCALKATIQDDRIVKIEPADFYTEEPRMKHCCLKAYATVRWTYNPDRIKYPMKRVGERGSGQWERISWEEALDTTAKKLIEIRDKYGSKAVMLAFGGSSTVGNLGGRLMGTRFANLWGGGGGKPPGYTTDGGVPAGMLYLFGDSGIGNNSLAFPESRLLIQWGGNIAESEIRTMRHVIEAKASGTKFTVVGVIFDGTAAKADQFIGVRLATDAALALSMINTIITEKLYDHPYVQKYTVGPFLVRSDTKMFLREADVVPNGSADNYMVWDANTQSAVAVPPQTQVVEGVDPALMGGYTVEGIVCKPAFQLLADRAAEYPADKAEEITTVPAKTIVDFAREYATTKPACIYIPAGLVRHYHGNIGARAVGILASICGNVGVYGGGPGGIQQAGSVSLNTRSVQTVKDAPGTERVPGARCEAEAWAAIHNGSYPIKAYVGGYRNFMQAYGNGLTYREILSKFEFICQIGIFMDMTTSYADIVLPDATTFERADIIEDAYGLFLMLTDPIPPVFECKPNPEIYSELAKRVGLGDYFQKSTEEWLQEMISGDDPSLQGVTWEQLKKVGYARANVPFKMEVSYADKIFPTPSGRIELYQEVLIPMGEELPIHKENLESPRTSPNAAKYPLSYMTKRSRYFTQTSYSNADWLRAIVPEPFLDINPADAEKRGIKDGDFVRVFNDRGDAVCRCRFTQSMPPGLVNIDHGWWEQDFKRGHYNFPTWAIDAPETLNPALLTPMIQKDSAAAQHTLIYDVLVEVEKFEA